MDEIRRVIATMEAEERHLLQVRLHAAQTTAWRTSAFILIGNGLAFALLCASTILVGRELLRRRAVARAEGTARRPTIRALTNKEVVRAERVQLRRGDNRIILACLDWHALASLCRGAWR